MEFIFEQIQIQKKDYNIMTYKDDDSIVWQQFISLINLFMCLIFTLWADNILEIRSWIDKFINSSYSSLCGFQYFQAASPTKSVTITEAFYFSIVTLW
jgi:hypothetical protein